MTKFNLIYDRLKCCTIVIGTSLSLTIGLNSRTLAQSNLIPPSPAVCDLDLASLKSVEIEILLRRIRYQQRERRHRAYGGRANNFQPSW
jgi:hypothetical protein